MSSARKQFLEHYATIRAAEGRGSEDSAYYRALPLTDPSAPLASQWAMRARTFAYFVEKLLPKTPCRILDLGAGNCWLSNRLAELGHQTVAADIFADARDGLRAARHYATRFSVVLADFNELPFARQRFDLILYNSSIHYSANYVGTLREARRCLKPSGRVVILDSPIYRRPEHGEAMRAERQQSFERQYGFRSESLRSIEYLDLPSLQDLSRTLRLRWTVHKPWYGFQWHLRPLRAWWRNQRPPSRFWILVGAFE